MEIEKLIEKLRTESLYKDKATLEIMDLCMDAALALEQLQAENDRLKEEVQQMRWIPVEERLPEEEGTYAVCVDGEVKWDAYCRFGRKERWLCYDGRLNALYIDPYSSKPKREPPYPRVTHWMPLPEAPKEVTHEK